MRRAIEPTLLTAAAVAACAVALAAPEPGSEAHLATADLGMVAASAEAVLCGLRPPPASASVGPAFLGC